MCKIGKSSGIESASINVNSASVRSSALDDGGTEPGRSTTILPVGPTLKTVELNLPYVNPGRLSVKIVSEVLSRCHALNIPNPSSDEGMFLLLYEEFGMSAACFFEKRLSMKAERIRSALQKHIRNSGPGSSCQQSLRG